MSAKHGFAVGLAVLIGLALVASPAYAKRDRGAQATADQKVTLPEDAAKAVRSADDAAIVSKFMKVEMRAEVRQDGGIPKLVKCEKPKTAYEGVLAKGGLTGRIKVAEDGTVITSVAWDTQTSVPAAKVKGDKAGKGGKKKNK